MRGNEGDFFADLTTAPIFEDVVYESEALGLPETQNEDQLEEQLAVSARESGIEDPYAYFCTGSQDLSTAISTMTVSSEHRSSMSIHSRETQSTGFTSHPSRTSKDTPYFDQLPSFRATPPLARPSLSLDYCDAVLDRFRPGVRHRHSSSAASGANSVFSTSSSLSKPATRKQKRASGLFSMFRRDVSACSSRSHQSHHVKPLSPKLDCGHSLSKYAIRVHIQDALESGENLPPSCCGKPLPRSVLETVLTKQETDIVMNDSLQLQAYSPLQDSGYSEDGVTDIDLSGSLASPSHPTGSLVAAPDTASRDMAHEDEECLNSVLANEVFKGLRAQQKEQFRRVALFESNQRKALLAYHQWSLKRLALQRDTNKAEKTRQHALELERLDETQILAEHDLRKSQGQETQNAATALKYMEAYCSGSNPVSPETVHTVTEEDRKKLARQHVLQVKLPAKHESAINVLRAKQEKDTKMKLQKQSTDLLQLDAEFEKEKCGEEMLLARQLNRLETTIESRRKRLMNRWELQFDMWRRDWENQHGTTLNRRLPHEEWPKVEEAEEEVDPSSALALYFQMA
ncbi:hypothetical protein K469DRAFT_717123 [Zopfia rhizophila CBS 207.26]|uniref:Uncharacterized protein n=1 Tax=Zopfia rhizophila CBS 207.26 TaxID=1314779 RepID=A0A6A6ENM6_9PEZI|nr:hypothetical protein K469DRAFT_717123 [Zopfia rhizophila CBS 207.26]